MSENQLTDGKPLEEWSNLEKKKEIFVQIIGEIIMNPELGQRYVNDPNAAKEDIKKLIKVPDDVKIVFLQEGDSGTEGGGSVVIELPPTDPAKRALLEPMELFLCTYNPW